MHESERSVTSPRQHHRRFQGRFPSSLEVMADNNSFQLTHRILSYTANNPQGLLFLTLSPFTPQQGFLTYSIETAGVAGAF